MTEESSRTQTNPLWMIAQIAIVIAAFFATDPLLTFVRDNVPLQDLEEIFGPRASIIIDMIVVPATMLTIIWIVMRLGGETMADFGLRRPKNWRKTIAFGVLIGAVIFVAIFASEQLGAKRDLSNFNYLSSIPMLLVSIVFAFLGAASVRKCCSAAFCSTALPARWATAHLPSLQQSSFRQCCLDSVTATRAGFTPSP